MRYKEIQLKTDTNNNGTICEYKIKLTILKL